ncbi:MAG: hypothetical protein EXR39_12785 [Betaproteobacteria bacterium]|nr:hypothetical protein [Betaproteobacteria bacterium]
MEPIHAAQLASIGASRVKTMDETPIKAARAGPGKMHTGYFWPLYREQDEASLLRLNWTSLSRSVTPRCSRFEHGALAHRVAA